MIGVSDDMRDTKYHTHVLPNLEIIKSWASMGYSNESIAKALGIGYSTFRKYVNEHDDLAIALTVSKEIADMNVEASLYKRSCGYEYTETIDSSEGVTTIHKHEPAHPGSAMFWLRNRKSELWSLKERAQVEKLKADKEYIEARTRLLTVLSEDNELLESLIDAVTGGSVDIGEDED